jgi:YjbE family integral membrane protein
MVDRAYKRRLGQGSGDGRFGQLIEQWISQFGPALGDYGPIGVQILKIIWINILLSGDNAVVIALACRGLPRRQRMWGIILGAGAAVVLRIFFTVALQYVLELPWLRLVGGILLLYIAIKLLVQEEANEDSIDSADNLWGAVKTVAIADIVMSLDNVLAIAAAAKGHPWLISFGLLVSIPLIVAGATLIMALLNRFPILVWAGAGLLGWIAGELLMEDPISKPYLDAIGADYGLAHRGSEIVMQVACTLFVLFCGWLLMKWQRRGSKAASEQKSAAE